MTAKDKIKNGWIHVLITLEVVGKPKEHVEESLKQLVERLKQETERLEFLEHHLEEATEHEDGYSSTFAEIDLLAKDIESLTWLAANYTPASIEVIEPTSFKFDAGDLQRWYTHILETMHTIGYAHKTQQGEMLYIKHQLRTLLENSILLSLGRSKKNIEQIHKDTSIDKKAIEAHLGALQKLDKVAVNGEVWSLA